MGLTLVSAWTLARTRLQAAGVDSPVLDARMLVEAAAGVARLDIIVDPYRALTEAAEQTLEVLLVRREAREPVAQILGVKPFRRHVFKVSPAVLTPRPETELVVGVALELVAPDAPARVLDLGVGSGAILLSILAERPLATGLGVDVSAEALAVAQANREALGLQERAELAEGDWGAGLAGPFDLIVSNPPYVRSGALSLLAPEVVRYEPRVALDGGPDGYDCYRALLPDVARLLAPGGAFVLETGEGQAEGVWAHAVAAGLHPQGVRDDYAGIGRIVFGRGGPDGGGADGGGAGPAPA